MDLIKGANLALAFAVELAMLVALGVWAFGLSQVNWLRWGLVVLVVGATVVLWAVVAAPASNTRLSQPWLSLFQMFLFASTALALLQAGLGSWGVIFAVIAAANLGLAAILGQL